MNNLHRGLAPISDAAWTQMEEEASRTLDLLCSRHSRYLQTLPISFLLLSL